MTDTPLISFDRSAATSWGTTHTVTRAAANIPTAATPRSSGSLSRGPWRHSRTPRSHLAYEQAGPGRSLGQGAAHEGPPIRSTTPVWHPVRGGSIAVGAGCLREVGDFRDVP